MPTGDTMPPLSPKNQTAKAHLAFRARGNPPSTTPASAISNCFPGLEFDIRNVWKLIFEGIELHEAGLGSAGHLVVDVQPGSTAALAGITVFDRLVEVDGRPVDVQEILPEGPTADRVPLEWSNALTHVITKAGQTVDAVFERETGRVSVTLTIRPMFEGVALAEPLAEPGALTQSLCSPWQADYRECGCYYWAASRPDFVNVDETAAGDALGHDWMQRDRSTGAPYRADRGGFSPNHIQYDDLYAEWERHLRFVIGGRDQ